MTLQQLIAHLQALRNEAHADVPVLCDGKPLSLTTLTHGNPGAYPWKDAYIELFTEERDNG